MYDPSNILLDVCLYDPRVDMRPVDPNGFLNLDKMAANGVIDGDILIDDSKFNGVADPDAMLPRPLDQFERIRQYSSVKESLKVAKANADASHSSEQTK